MTQYSYPGRFGLQTLEDPQTFSCGSRSKEALRSYKYECDTWHRLNYEPLSANFRTPRQCASRDIADPFLIATRDTRIRQPYPLDSKHRLSQFIIKKRRTS